MKILTKKQESIPGGGFGYCVGDTRLSETVFNTFFPDPTGQTTFTSYDFPLLIKPKNY